MRLKSILSITQKLFLRLKLSLLSDDSLFLYLALYFSDSLFEIGWLFRDFLSIPGHYLTLFFLPFTLALSDMHHHSVWVLDVLLAYVASDLHY